MPGLSPPELGTPAGVAGRTDVESALDRMLDAGTCAAVVLMPQRFHEVVVALGRTRAAALLAALEARLADTAGAGAVVGRLAPTSFAVALPAADAREPDVAGLLASLDAPLIVDGVPFPLLPAAGVAYGPHDGGDGVRLLDRAELALHVGDGPGGAFTPAMEQTARRRIAVLTDLERGLAAGQLHLHFQPIVDIATETVDAVEALVRWDHPVHGAMPPATFIPLAEQTGLIGPLTEHVLALALDHCAAWRADGLALRVAVNLSARNVADPLLPRRVAEMLAARGLDGGALHLEITESVLMEDAKVGLRTLASLRALGVELALDDFGTGYSSLAYLKDLPIDELKIDRSFVRLIGEEERSQAVLRSIVGLAGDLGLRTVAEGVEDAATLRTVGGLGCTLAQGFHYTRPLAPPALRTWIERRERLLAPAASPPLG